MAGSYFLGVPCLHIHLHIPHVYSLSLQHTDIPKGSNDNLKALLNYEVIVRCVLLYYTSYAPQMCQKLYERYMWYQSQSSTYPICGISLRVARTLYVASVSEYHVPYTCYQSQSRTYPICGISLSSTYPICGVSLRVARTLYVVSV
jgi:hypothetical protein